MSLIDLQRAFLPNIPILKGLIPWFDAVSAGLDSLTNGSQIIAAAVVDGGANIQRQFGFTAPVAHPSAGNFTLTFAETQDPNLLYPTAVIYSPTSPPAGALDIYPVILSPTQMSVAIWQIAMTTAARSQVDEQFCVTVVRGPLP